MYRPLLWLAMIVTGCQVFWPTPLWSEEPEMVSVFPLGGQRGTRFQVEVRGEHLQNISGVWFDSESLHAQPVPLETTGGDEESAEQVLLTVDVDADAVLGAHPFRLIGPDGVSAPLTLNVHAERAMLESAGSHDTADQAQPIDSSVVINGCIAKPGERDHYVLDVVAGQKLRFEVITPKFLLGAEHGAFDQPEMILYERRGSLFDTQRLVRLEVADESVFYRETNAIVFLPRVSYHFETPLRCFVAVGALQGVGGSGHFYQLRVVSDHAKVAVAKKRWYPREVVRGRGSDVWPFRGSERQDLRRAIHADRLKRMWLRGGRSPGVATDAAHAESFRETEEIEPNDVLAGAVELDIPRLVHGRIDRPGDVDTFRFKVSDGQSLAFEIETPEIDSPHFSPLLQIVDAQGEELCSNIFRITQGDGDDWVKKIQPKVRYVFDEEGEYFLRIRDLTSRRADVEFAYRVLMRPQIPHLGGSLATGSMGAINLPRGTTRELVITTELDEGYDLPFTISMENLAPGVEIFPAATLPTQRVGNRRSGPRGETHRERFFPHRATTKVMLVADPEAALTRIPQWVIIKARPVVEGKAMEPVVVQRFLLMVVGEEIDANLELDAVPESN